MTRHRLSSFAFLMIALLGLTAELSAQKKKVTRAKGRALIIQGTPQLSPEAQKRQDAFAKAWSTLNENYFDQTFSGLDWQKIRDEYQPRVAVAKTDAQVHKLITEMIGRLGKSHFAVIPPDYFDALKVAKAAARERERLLAAEGLVVAEPDDTDESNEDLLEDNPDARYGIGVDLRLINKQFVITHIEPGSSADLAGIKLGFVVDKINGVSLQDLVRRITTDYSGVKNLERYLPAQVINWFLNGERDTAVFLTCLNAADQPLELKVDRLSLSGERISLGARFPEQFMQFDAVSLDENVGYIKFNVFSLLVVTKFCDALTKFNDKSAIIIDLRGNMGGVLGTLIALTGMMSERTITLGTSIYKVGTEPLIASAKAKNYRGKIVFLVDNQTVSAAEVFSAGMQENNRALVVGQRTGGEALPAVTTPLATGAVLVFPIANFLTNKGKSLEGNGVEPDFTVQLDRQSLLKGIDPQMSKAMALIKEGSAFPNAVSTIVSGSGIASAPPPPPPIARKQETLAPPPPRRSETQVPAVAKDKESLKLIADFVSHVGGVEAFKKLRSYVATGKATINLRGTETATGVFAARQFPDKYGLVLTVDAVGDVREIYNGKMAFLQTDFGLERELGADSDLTKSDLFSAVLRTVDPDNFRTLAYKGAIHNEGRRVNVIQATTPEGVVSGLAFDVKTGMLVTFVSPGVVHSLGDYRKVGDISLPFSLDMSGVMKVQLDSVKLNTPIDQSYFERKKFCYDKAQ